MQSVPWPKWGIFLTLPHLIPHWGIAFTARFCYRGCMDTAIELRPAGLHLLIAPTPLLDQITGHLVARLALDGGLRLLDAGNRFPLQRIARLIRRETPNLEAALRRIQIARAFNAHQLLAALEKTGPGPQPLLVLNLPAVFAVDMNADERARLAAATLTHLERLARSTPLLVSARAGGWLPQSLVEVAGQVWRFEIPSAPIQTVLF